ncbi:hypothetical protein HDE76_000017 [Rhodanobacter sp. ANJX3]|uniref:hypothetical protein n=1 Tax=Rhodanobacter sp. ANJX3 TaxID=2723083 RepID=UPI00161AEBB4|nr:hypothetical protein [Rhodanobacter sp. ANJX3]MBB5356835.1 hypothetical protein [Rhodanobacter sp. ANJX3]
MNMIKVATVLFSMAFIGATFASNADGGIWSKNAKDVGENTDSTLNIFSARSPDGKKTITFTNNKLMLIVGGKTLADLTDSMYSPRLTEISWSPDSLAFFVNASDGGVEGTWVSSAYLLVNNAVKKVSVGEKINLQSTLSTDCKYKNLGSVAWLNGHRNLLLIEQVPDSSSCSHMGEATGYLYDVEHDSIANTLSPDKIKSQYSEYLGSQAKSALQ